MLCLAFAETQRTPMTDADNTTSLQEQLAAHRRTLAVLLRQLANLGADHAPPGVHNGIAEAHREIARLKAALRAVGVAVEDQVDDKATAEEEAGAHQAPGATVSIRRDQINAQGSQGFINQAQSVTQNFNILPQPRPTLDPAQAQQLLDRLPLDVIPDPADLPVGSRMQLLRNTLFVGREADLKAIAKSLKGGQAAAIATGIGGVGKTQLASEFVHRYGQFFAGGVFWLSFADPTGIDSEIAACGGAGAMNLYTDAQGLVQAEQVARVYAEWALPIPRLLIFDNCDDLPSLAAELLLTDRMPKSGGCRVLVTSRRGQWHESLGIAALSLGVLSRPESIALLRSHRDDISNVDADTIADLLGDLPLALSLAGSYLEIYGNDRKLGDPQIYLKNLRKKLLNHRSLQGVSTNVSLTKHELNVHATFALSYQRLNPTDSVDALAITALARAAHMAPGEPFPRSLLLATLGNDTEDEEIAAQRADTLARLVALGLLEVAEEGALRIHQLLATFAQTTCIDIDAQVVVERTLTDTSNLLVNDGYSTRLLPVLAHLRHRMKVADLRADAQAGALANALGRAENMLTNYVAARSLHERAVQITEQALGPQHPDTAQSLNNLAYLLHTQGDTTAARALYERALSIREQVLGPQHPDTASSLNNLAYLLRSQDNSDAARPLYERALSIREQVLGPQHADTAQSLNNLAGLLARQGDFGAARSLYERALAIYEQVLGPQHPDTASSLNNLAGLLVRQGDSNAARPLYERALATCEQSLGLDHRTTRTIRANLAALDAPSPSATQ
jgi:Tfp pilus assembly protein PilF